jgi:adenylyltransferase/sulfurtransferase
VTAAVQGLDDRRIARYARQLLVPGFGEAAQQRLASARVRVVGADALASAALLYLVQAGVGRIWIDDPGAVAPQDEGGWLYPPGAAGRPRAQAAAEALGAMSQFTAVEPYPDGGVPSAALVAAPAVARALQAAAVTRRAGVPHVVIEADADGGTVVTIPPGAPCYACARSTTAPGRPPLPGAAAVAVLGAQELVLLLALPGTVGGRRLDVARGLASMRPTVRLAGCACARAAGAAAGEGRSPAV